MEQKLYLLITILFRQKLNYRVADLLDERLDNLHGMSLKMDLPKFLWKGEILSKVKSAFYFKIIY